MTKEKKMNKGIKIVLLSAVLLLVVLTVAYAGVAVHYQSHFLPNTTINDIVCDDLEISEVKELLSIKDKERVLELIGRNVEGESEKLGQIRAHEIELQSTNYVVELHKYLDQQNSWLWIQNYINDNMKKEITISPEISFNRDTLKACLAEMLKPHNTENTKVQNAYISSYNIESNSYEVVSEQMGSTLDLERVQLVVENALQEEDVESINLEEEECYVIPEITSEDAMLTKTVDTVNTWLQAEITYDWNGNQVVVDKELLKDWVSVKNDQPMLDEKAIEEFVTAQAKEYDTYGKNRNFHTTLGHDLTLPSGAFGWKTDCEAEVKELINAIQSGEKVKREPVYSSKAPWKGNNDIGNSYVEIDLTNQHLYLYKQGAIVLESNFVSGDMNGDGGCPTPAGVFGLTYKTTNAVLRGADYETSVVYWMPYHGNFGMHDATWRTEFGGDIYLTEGSHGCVNLPLESAAAIYSQISAGFPVICYYY